MHLCYISPKAVPSYGRSFWFDLDIKYRRQRTESVEDIDGILIEQ